MERYSGMPGIDGYRAALQDAAVRQHGELQSAQVQGGLLKMVQEQQQAQALRNALSTGNIDEIARISPQAAAQLAQVQDLQAKQAQAKKVQQFYSPENQARFVEGGSPAIPAPAEELGGGPARPEQPGQLNFGKFLQSAAASGVVNPETYANHQMQNQSRIDALQAKIYDIDRRSEDKGLDRESKERLAIEGENTRRVLAQLVASSRQHSQPAPIVSNEGLFDRGPNGTLVPLVNPITGQPLKPAASGRVDLTYATQLQRQLNQFNKPYIDNLAQVGMYDQARQSGDTAQAAQMAASALRQASRSNNRALKGDVEKLLGQGYGSGNIAERIENFISNELSGSPSNNTLAKLDSVIRASESANLSAIAMNLNNMGSQAAARGIPLAHVTLPVQRGNSVAFPDGNVARFKTSDAAKAAINTWIESNQ